MRKTFLAAAAVATLLSSLAVDAQALTIPRTSSQDDASPLTQVRNGCGFRRHWSPRLQRCVWNG